MDVYAWRVACFSESYALGSGNDTPLGWWAVLGVARYRHEADDPDLGTVVLESTSERAGAP
jgi:hypothetical protein